jgi:hypothetical protein
MSSQLMVLGLLMSCLAFAAGAEDCTSGRFKGAIAGQVQTAYRDALEYVPDMLATREALSNFRQTESTCIGQNSLEFVIALIEVNEAPLQQAVDALPTIIKSSAGDYNKARMADRLIDRLYEAHQYDAALGVARQAHELFAEMGQFERESALLLAFTGSYEEASSIADRRFDASLETTPKGIVPYDAWVRLAITELNGDESAREAVLAKLSVHLGKDAGTVVAADVPGSILAMVMAREFDLEKVSQPSEPPRPSYPQSMAALGKEGSCETYFEVSAAGVPEKITAVCSSDGFKDVSERAVAALKFRPFLVNGEPARRVSMSYPLKFKLAR